MGQQIEFEGVITAGHFPAKVRESITAVMQRMEGKRLELVLRQPKKYSTDPQRRYYFKVIVPAIQRLFFEAGTVIDKLEMHHWLMENVGKWFREVVTPDGEVTQVRRSYMDLDTMETETHHTLCRQWAAEHGVDVMEPNEDGI